jgi:hypothetical protein
MVTAKQKAQAGFTVMEILVVMGLSFIGLLGMLSLQIVAQRANMQSRAITEATGLVQDKLEELRRRPLRLLSASAEKSLDGTGLIAMGGGFSRRVALNPTGAGVQVRVEVAWADTRGVTHQVAMATVRAP